MCSDTSAVQSIVTMKQDEDKLVPVDSHKLFAVSGEAGDRVNFSEYIIANVRLYALRNGAKLSTKAVANFTRSELATALRKVCTLHCGMLEGLSGCHFAAFAGAHHRALPPAPECRLGGTGLLSTSSGAGSMHKQ